MTIETRFLASVAERDIDLLLVEELTVNPEFGDWFSSRVFGRPVFKEAMGTWHSVTDAALGESDVIFRFRGEDDGRVAVLIENKIDAVAQPQQAARYRQRGEKGVPDDWDTFLTCVIAPKQYLSAGNQTEGYDSQVTYEEILSFFVSGRSRDPRFAFKAQVVLEAIEKNRRGYVAEISEAMTAYVRDYCRLAVALAPECRVQEAKPRPARSTWVQYRPDGLPKNVSVWHQLTAGYVKLFVNGAAAEADQVLAPFRDMLPQDVEAGVAGKSVVFSVVVPKLAPLEKTVAAEQVAVEQGIQAVRRLVGLYRTVMR
jgi:hypothetical protein